MKKKEMIGKKFGMLTVLNSAENDSKGHLMYVCECECGVIKNIHGTHLRAGKTVSCGCKNKLKGISSDFWYNIIKGSLRVRTSRNKLEVNITKEYIYNLFIEQEGKCKLSGVPIKLPQKWKDNESTASLDRIDSSLGYIVGNVQWVHKHINVMKNIYPQDMFIYLCNQVTKNNELKGQPTNNIDEFKFGLNEKYKKRNL
jgi:hypothetical protein